MVLPEEADKVFAGRVRRDAGTYHVGVAVYGLVQESSGPSLGVVRVMVGVIILLLGFLMLFSVRFESSQIHFKVYR